MKKLLVLLVLVVAVVAAPVFAEVTQGAYAGDFTYKIGGNFKNAAVDNTADDLDLSLSASVGEYTTFSVGMSGAGHETDKAYTAPSYAGDVTFDSIEMTQDFSSLIGDAATLKMTVGNFNREITEYENIGFIDHVNGATDDALMLTLGVADLTVYAWASPTSALNPSKAGLFTLEAVYATDMISGNVAFLNAGTAKGVFEAGLKVAAAGATVYGMMEADLDTEVNLMTAEVSYAMAPVTVNAGVSLPDLSDTKAAKSIVKGGVDFAATDMVTLKAGASYFMDIEEFGFDGGVCAKVDTVDYTLGVSYKGSTYMAPYGTIGTEDVSVSLKMDVDF